MTNAERDRAIADLAQTVQTLLVIALHANLADTTFEYLKGMHEKLDHLRTADDERDGLLAQIQAAKDAAAKAESRRRWPFWIKRV